MKDVSETVAREFVKQGKLLGKSTPCTETKWTWWQVYSYNNRIVAVCMDSTVGIHGGEEITLDELNLYVD